MAKKPIDTTEQPVSSFIEAAVTNVVFFLKHAKFPREFNADTHGPDFRVTAQEFSETNKDLITRIEADGKDINAPEAEAPTE